MSTLLLSKPSEVPYGELIPTQIISTAYEELYSKKKRENEEFLRLLKKGLDEKYSKSEARMEFDEKYVKSEAREELLRLDADKIIYQSDGTIERMTQVPQYKRENDIETFVIEKFVDLPSNFIGDYLTSVMKKIKTEELETELEKKQEYENKVKSIYFFLKDKISTGKDNLELFLNKDIDEMIELCQKKEYEFKVKNYKDDTEMSSYFLENPSLIPSILRHFLYEDYNANLRSELENNLLICYVNMLLDKKGYSINGKSEEEINKINKERNEIQKKLLEELSEKNQFQPLLKRLVELYKLQKLTCDIPVLHFLHKDDVVFSGIDLFETYTRADDFRKKRIADMKMMVKIVKKVGDKVGKKIDLSRVDTKKVGNQKKSSKPFEKEVVYDFTSIHNPMHPSEIVIDFMTYNSVIDYVVKNMSKWLDRNTGYKYEHLNYIDKKIAYEHGILLKTASDLLNKKYECKDKEPSHIAKLLLSTEDQVIIYNDESDPIFGSGGNPSTNNFIGKKLMSIRDDVLKKKYMGYKVELPKIKMISDMFQNKTILEFALAKVKDLNNMILYVKEILQKPQFTDLQAFQFIYKNFLDCIEKRTEKDEKDNTKIVTKYITYSKFNKANVPADFTEITGINCSKECKQELWKYMYYVYTRTLSLYNEKRSDGEADGREIMGDHIFVVLNKLLEQKIKKETTMLSLFSTDSFEDLKKYEKPQPGLLDQKPKPILPHASRRNPYVTVKNEKIDFTQFGGFNEDILSEIQFDTPINYALFLTTEESQYSSLMPSHIPHVRDIMENWFKNPKVIIDATAHVGVDTIHFATMFTKAEIYSYEINNQTFQLLEENVKRQEQYTKKLKNLSKRLHVINSDFNLAELPVKMADFVYIDAPWGGPSYKKIQKGKLELYLGNVNIKEVARLLLVGGRTKEVVIKVPYNYRFDNLENWFMFDIKEVEGTTYSLVKLQIKSIEIKKCNIRTLCVSTFVSILNAIKIYRKKDKIEESDLKLAFRLMYLSEDSVFPDKQKPYNEFYLEIISSLFNVDNNEIEKLKTDDKKPTKKDILIGKIINDMKQSKNIYDYKICDMVCEKCGSDEHKRTYDKHECKFVCVTEHFKEYNEDIILNFGEISKKIEEVKRETFIETFFAKKDVLEKLSNVYNGSGKLELEFPDVDKDLLKRYEFYIKERYEALNETENKKMFPTEDLDKMITISIVFQQLVEAIVNSIEHFEYKDIIKRLMLFSNPRYVVPTNKDMIDQVLYVQDENIVDEIENENEEEEEAPSDLKDIYGDVVESDVESQGGSDSIRSLNSGDEFGGDDDYNYTD
jgi:hypothetical protein